MEKEQTERGKSERTLRPTKNFSNIDHVQKDVRID